MGFLYLAIKIPKAITFTFFVSVLNHLKFMVIGALTHLGLYKPPPEEDSSRDNLNDFVLIFDGSSPSLIPIPVHVVTAAIKKRLPVVQYGDFIGSRVEEEEEEEEEETSHIDEGKEIRNCPICLDGIERSHDIRELHNCSHVFHRECLDTWVDEGQVTCPLCRSMLLPPKKILASSAGVSRGGGGDAAALMIL